MAYKNKEQYQFVTVTKDFMAFGYGRHAWYVLCLLSPSPAAHRQRTVFRCYGVKEGNERKQARKKERNTNVVFVTALVGSLQPTR
jgi:hypothetical protein